MKYQNKIATAFCAAALGLMTLTSCEGGDLFSIDSPDWLSSKADSIAAEKAKNQGGDDVIEGLQEDVYTIGNTDYTSGWWSSFSKYYQIPDGEKWVAQFNLNINPNDNTYYKNFALVVCSDDDRGGANYVEYGAYRYDATGDSVAFNSQWGTDLYFKFTESTQIMAPVDNADAGLQKLGGKVTLTVDRSDASKFVINISNSNGVVKTYTQPYPLRRLPEGTDNSTIRCFIVPEGSYINFLGSTIEPIGGFTSKDDKQPVSLELTGVPSEVLVGTEMEEAFANVTGVVNFEEGVSKAVTAEDLQFEAIPNFQDLGQKTLVVIYNKTFKGENAAKPVIAVKTFSVVNELSAFTETVVVPNPHILGLEDNSSGWWSAHTDNIKVEPKETKVVNFTNYTTGENNWNNFVIVLNKENLAEYAVVRADNYGWGDGYAAATNSGGQADWDAWRAAMNGAKVTAYITNNGDGTANIKAVMHGTDGVDYVQEYNGINTIDPDDFYFRFTVDGCHLVFDNELGLPDCTSGWWSAHSPLVQVSAHQVCTVNFTNYTSGAGNWNNFVIVLNRADLSEYAVVRADNYGWGDGYAAATNSGGQADWDAWRAAMNGAKCTAQIINKGDGTADIKVLMHGNDGVDYIQDYIGINTIDPDNFYFRFTVDSSYLVFE